MTINGTIQASLALLALLLAGFFLLEPLGVPVSAVAAAGAIALAQAGDYREAIALCDEALTKAEAGKSATEGKTFGDLIKANELPGTAEAAK